MNGTELKIFSDLQNFNQNCILRPEEKSSNCLILKFVFIQCKAVKVNQNDQNQM